MTDGLKHQFWLNKVSRERINCLVENYLLGQLLEIPDGFNNNLLWNYGHIAVTQQLLTVGLSNAPMQIPKELVDKYRKGSDPKDITSPKEDLDYFRKNYVKLAELTPQMLENGDLGPFNPYKTSYGIELNNLEEAVIFNNVHEGIHLGYMMAIRRLLSPIV